MKSIYGFINTREKTMKCIFAGCAVFSIFALVSITVFLFVSGLPFIAKIGFGNFIFGTEWAPLASSPSYGIFSMIVTTLFVTALSVIIGVGVGLLTSICLYKFCPKKLVAPIRQMVNLLAGIPSVIFGLFGMTVIVPFIRDYVSPNGVGYGIFSASIVLAIMVLPTIVSVSLDAMQSVPGSYFEGAIALGATKEQATFKVMIPGAKSGILAGVVLAVGRAIGETMAVIMVIGGSPEMPESLFQSVRTLTANIAMGAMELNGDALSALIASGVVLFVFTLLLNFSFSMLKGMGKKDRKQKKNGKINGKKYGGNAYLEYKRIVEGADATGSVKENGTYKKASVGEDIANKRASVGKDIANKRASVGEDIANKRASVGKDIANKRASVGKDIANKRASVGKDSRIKKAEIGEDIKLGRASVGGSGTCKKA